MWASMQQADAGWAGIWRFLATCCRLQISKSLFSASLAAAMRCDAEGLAAANNSAESTAQSASGMRKVGRYLLQELATGTAAFQRRQQGAQQAHTVHCGRGIALPVQTSLL